MFKKRHIYIIVFIAFFACKTREKYSEIPAIKILESSFKITFSENSGTNVKKAVLKIEVTDGDGDIGSQEIAGIDSAHFDVFLGFNPYVNGELVLGSDLGYKEDPFRIPNTQPYNKNEFLKAEIELVREYPVQIFPYDSVEFYVRVFDLADNESNTAYTEMMIVK